MAIKARVVSMPSWELFEQQDQANRDAVLPPEITAHIAIELASTFGWAQYENLPGAYQAMARLEALGISMAAVTDELEAEGVKSFASAWNALVDAMEVSHTAAVGED